MVDFHKIQQKWQKRWKEAGIFTVTEDTKKPKYYVLEMYPYPSGSALHMGHVRNYTIGDSYARFKRMNGFNVLYPMGYDAFGLPAENAAIKNKIHPQEFTEKAIKTIRKQMEELGLSYDWNRVLASCDPEYYTWNQWFFLKFIERGIAYRKKAPINWCPKCDTVLANEQVENGTCWRCDSEVEIKHLEQWFFKTTAYADQLLDDLEKLKGGWSDRILTMQRNWIGRSEGTEIQFRIEGTKHIIPVFTTRVDTLYGVTFMVFAPEHHLVSELVKGTKYEKDVKEFVKRTVIQSRMDRMDDTKEKQGMFIGHHVINPVTDEKIPLYIGDFVLLEYGAGAVMAVPAHDQRDFEFAKKHDLPIKLVIQPSAHDINPERMVRAYEGKGRLVNSGEFSEMQSWDATPKLQEHLKKKKLGGKTVQYKLRDWLISRQRYWGTPIPVVYCGKCGMVPVQEKDLPIKLPLDIVFTGKGNPLKTSKEFRNTTCPKCGGEAQRETDTMDGFMDSCWYFLRYTSPGHKEGPFDKDKVKYWMTVDQYIGGAEHAVMHLLYARFFCKVLKDMGLIDFDEPFTRLFNQGIVYKDGAKMSKSKGNVVGQDKIAKSYGIDTARLFLISVGSPDKQMEWDDHGIEGSYRFLKKALSLLEKPGCKVDKKVLNKMHRTIRKVTEYIESFSYNKAVILLNAYANYLNVMENVPKESLEIFALLLQPFVPHLSEEMWERLGHKDFSSLQTWPKWEEKHIDDEIEASEALVETMLHDITTVLGLAKIQKPKEILIFTAAAWKYTLFDVVRSALDKSRDFKEVMGVVMKDAGLKKHGKDISRMLPGLVKEPRRLKGILSATVEGHTFNEAAARLKKVFDCKITILSEEKSKESKARQALPGKPALLVK